MIPIVAKLNSALEKAAKIANECFQDLDSIEIETKLAQVRKGTRFLSDKHQQVIEDARVIQEVGAELQALVPNLGNQYPDVLNMLDTVEAYASMMARDALSHELPGPVSPEEPLKPSI